MGPSAILKAQSHCNNVLQRREDKNEGKWRLGGQRGTILGGYRTRLKFLNVIAAQREVK
jgi:hypothetical protein